MNAISYNPAGNYLIVKLDKSIEDIKTEEGKSAGGIVIPGGAKEAEQLPVTGVVVASGPEAYLDPQLCDEPIRRGHRVDFFLFRGFPRRDLGVDLIQINSNQILGVIPDNTTPPGSPILN